MRKRTPKKRSKYNNIKTIIDGITFDSKKEGAHYYKLKAQLLAGTISDLKLQPKFNIAASVILDGKRKPKSKQALIHDDETMMIDKAVSMIKSDSPVMAKIIKKVYVDEDTIDEVARYYITPMEYPEQASMDWGDKYKKKVD